MSTFHFQPIKGRAREILKAILQTPEISACKLKETMLLRLACEELVMNITSYAYPEDIDGFMDVDLQRQEDRIVIRFTDGGIPFNPLEHKKPDPTLPWKLRHIGGLGIYLVLKKMDHVHYTYENSCNILTIEKMLLP